MSTLSKNLACAIASMSLVSAWPGEPAEAQTRPFIADLQAQITALQADNVPGLANYLVIDSSNPVRPVALFHGVNVQIVNDMGATSQVNGLGNLIVGYDEVRTTGNPVCSIGDYTDETTCLTGGGTWALSHKSGSHNVVIGRQHSYSRYASLVAGFRNIVNGPETSVTGGTDNVASLFRDAVSGGAGNIARGGAINTASGPQASVHGGHFNTASGAGAAVSGGATRSATGTDDWVAGALFQDD